MWTKFIIGVSAMAVLTACGNAVGESPLEKKNTEASDINALLDGNATVTGRFPATTNPDVSAFQARLMIDLKNGVPAEVFEGANPPVEVSISGGNGPQPIAPSGPVLQNRKYLMYLVENPVSRLPKSSVINCQAGEKLYRATIAAKPYLIRIPARTNAVTENVRPYDVDICDGENGLTYALSN